MAAFQAAEGVRFPLPALNKSVHPKGWVVLFKKIVFGNRTGVSPAKPDQALPDELTPRQNAAGVKGASEECRWRSEYTQDTGVSASG